MGDLGWDMDGYVWIPEWYRELKTERGERMPEWYREFKTERGERMNMAYL